MLGPEITERDVLESPRYLSTISDSNLPDHAKRTLIRGDIHYVAELVQKSERDLLRILHMGPYTLSKVNEMLDGLGLMLETKVIFDGPDSEFRTRLESAHRELSARSNPKRVALKSAGQKLLARLQLPSGLARKIQASPVLSGAVLQMIAAQKICVRKGLKNADVAEIVKASSHSESKKEKKLGLS